MEYIWVLLGIVVLYFVGTIGAKWIMSDSKKEIKKAPRKSSNPKQPEQKQIKKDAVSVDTDSKDSKEKWVPMDYMGRKRSYAYTGVRLYTVPGQEPDFKALDPGDDLELVQEPENTYDNKAVRVETFYRARAGKVKVGYLKKNRLQEMVNDYLNRGLPILAHIESIEDDEGWVEIAIAFYRDPVEYELGDDLDLDDE